MRFPNGLIMARAFQLVTSFSLKLTFTYTVFLEGRLNAHIITFTIGLHTLEHKILKGVRKYVTHSQVLDVELAVHITHTCTNVICLTEKSFQK